MLIATEAILETLKPGPKLTKLCKVYPHGSLYARMEASGGIVFWWRWTYNGADDKERIGLWDRAADPRRLERSENGWTVKAALRQAEEWALEHEHALPMGGFRASLEALQASEKEQQVQLQHHTLEHLLRDYVAELRVPRTASDARGIFRKHIELTHNHIWKMPAASVTREEVATLVRAVNAKGVHRTCEKLRTFLHAAFAMALGSIADTSIPEHFKAYKVVHNPVATVPVPKPMRTNVPKARVRALFVRDLQIYWAKIKNVPGRQGAILRLHLLTGGQRPAQLARLTPADVNDDSVRLLDSKGRGSVVREHMVPLTDLARQALKDAWSGGRYVLSSDGGETQLSDGVICEWAQAAVGDALPNFTLKLIRSGVETVLTQYGISEEHRGRLQSHGISGVQAAHYNAWEFFDEKRAALDVLEAAVVHGLSPQPVVHPAVLAMNAAKAAVAQAQAHALPPEIAALR